MKKIILFFVLICFWSLVNGTSLEPYGKEDFKERMNTALEYNRLKVGSEYINPSNENYEERLEEQIKRTEEALARLEELKEEAIKEYNIFYDAYYAADSKKVNEQVQKLKVIFDEMNPLMMRIVKFDGIYSDILFWSIQLDYYIEHKIIDPDAQNIDTSIPIQASKTKLSDEIEITDCCETEPEGNCCKAKKSISCCEKDPNSECCLQPKTNLLVLAGIVLALAIIVFGIIMFIRRAQ